MTTTISSVLETDLVERLRAFAPAGSGPMSYPAAQRLAEAQGEELAKLAGDTIGVANFIRLYSGIQVKFDRTLPVPSASQFNPTTNHRQIVVDGKLPFVQQDHELLREFKRILDARDAGRLYDPSDPMGEVQQLMCATFFARVAQMPQRQVRQAVDHGAKNLPTLAAMFDTWIDAAAMRVSDLELTDRIHTE